MVDEAGRAMTGQLVGELLIQGPTVMKGYFRDTDASRRAVRDGWLHTGDLALMDQDGYVSLVGRKKDIIVRGGENMVPQEIEEVLRCHSHVKDAVVIGAPDSIWGEVVTAFVIPDGPLRAEDLVEFCRPLLADFKLPQRIVQVDQLPRNEAGKLQRQVLRDLLQDMSEDGRGR